MIDEKQEQVNWLLAVLRKPEVTGDEAVADVLKTLSVAGVLLTLEGEKLKAKGVLTDEIRSLLRVHKAALVSHLSKPLVEETEPWDEAKVQAYIRGAKIQFGSMYDVMTQGKDDVWRDAAFGLMVDALMMLAEAIATRTQSEVMAKADYIAWLCKTIRQNLERFRKGAWLSGKE